VIDCYSPDCGDPGCEDCTRVLRPAIALRDALRAALAAEQPQPVASGWRLVPVEPTEDMLFAAELSLPRHYRDLYRAMLDAAPPAPTEQPVAWTVAFNGRADPAYAYYLRDGAESAADYLRAHKAELGPFTVVPLFAAPPPPAAEQARTLSAAERDVFDAALAKTTKRVDAHPPAAEPSEVTDAERYRFVRTADRVAISPQAARDPVAYDAAIDAAIAAAKARNTNPA